MGTTPCILPSSCTGSVMGAPYMTTVALVTARPAARTNGTLGHNLPNSLMLVT